MIGLLLMGAIGSPCSEVKPDCLGKVVKIDYHSPLTYDVVRIKLHGDNPALRFDELPNGFSNRGITLLNLIAMAFGVREEQIIGGPAWVRSTEFDVDARVDEEKSQEFKKLSRQAKGAMLRPILQERFHIELETGTKQISVYDLVVARGGPKLKIHSAADSVDPIHISAGNWIMPSMPISFLAIQLSGMINGIVCDQTGLLDKYDANLTFSSAELTPGAPASNASDFGPDLLTALKEQLGLQLVPTKQLIPVIVIKNVSRPLIE